MKHIYIYFCLFTYLWLRGLSLFVVSGGYSLQYLWLAEACGIFPDQGSNLCPSHYQADSLPLDHQGSPSICGCIFKPPHWIFKLLLVSPHCKFPLWYYPSQWSFVHILDSYLRNKPLIVELLGQILTHAPGLYQFPLRLYCIRTLLFPHSHPHGGFMIFF